MIQLACKGSFKKLFDDPILRIKDCGYVSYLFLHRNYSQKSKSEEEEEQKKPIGPGPSISFLKGRYAGDYCWSCKHFKEADNTIFCNICQKIQPPSKDQDYFDLMTMPKKFNLDIDLLEKRFQQMQRKVHPDLYFRKSEPEREFSAGNSSLVNEAYKTLKDPNERAKYILKLNGIDVEDEATTIDDPELLLEIMEKQELLEEDLSIPILQKMEKENNDALQALFNTIGKALDEKKFHDALKELIKVQYLVRLQTQLKDRLPAT